MHSSSAIPVPLTQEEVELRPARGADAHEALEKTSVGATVRIVAMHLEADFVDWLRAVGIHEGELVTVLRRALFGGPIHVRTGSGGEFALNRSLAESIRVIRPL